MGLDKSESIEDQSISPPVAGKDNYGSCEGSELPINISDSKIDDIQSLNDSGFFPPTY